VMTPTWLITSEMWSLNWRVKASTMHFHRSPIRSTNVENLTLTGSSAISGTGSTLANTIIGNSAANTLDGGAGADTIDGMQGADTLIGGTGNDTFVVDNVGDVITELANEGVDNALSSVTYTLSTNVENLTLTGSSPINAFGNGVGNHVVGNSGLNTLSGLGGDDTLIGIGGSDTLLGGFGSDTLIVEYGGNLLQGDVGSDLFIFTSILFTENTITDFTLSDRIRFSDISNITSVFSGSGSFTTNGSVEFQVGTNQTTLLIGLDSSPGADATIYLSGFFNVGSLKIFANTLFFNSNPTGSVTISGTATQGQVLTASNNLTDADGLGTISYQWLADGTNISGATSTTFTLTQAQVG
jgi:Ca2+-binding RTX toxin-like protein